MLCISCNIVKMRVVTVFCVLLFGCKVFSQTKIWNNWYFGEKAGLSFNTEPPYVLTDGQLFTVEGCASISDSNGNLLFYTNGVMVWDRNNNVMSNGTDLKGHTSSAQSALILPKPNSNHIYYIFTTNAHEDSERCLRYSVVDMTLNSGMGDIIASKKNILVHNNSSEGLSATIHSNGTDYWIISHSYNSSRFYCNLFSETGINTVSIISDISASYNVVDYLKIKVSSFSDKIAITNGMRMISLFDFNNTTGNISIDKSYNFTTYPKWGIPDIEFSQDNTKLYVSLSKGYTNNRKMKLFQFDLAENNFEPQEIISVDDYVLNAIQLASNGKIYASCSRVVEDNEFLSVINNPNEKGTNCDFQFNAIPLTPGKCKYGLPNCVFISHKLTFEADDVCLGDNNTFIINNTQGIQSQHWNFGDGTISTEQNPTHIYTAPDTYTVSLTATYTNNTTQTVTKEIEIFEKPEKPIIIHN